MTDPRMYYNEVDPHAAQHLRNLIDAGQLPAGDVDERDIRDVKPSNLDGYTQCHFFAGVGIWPLALRIAGWCNTQPIWTGSCPCQPLSSAGKGLGFHDERHLWPDWHWLIGQCRPETVFGEQVASADGLRWADLVSSDLEAQDYAFGPVDTCAAGFGAYHIRQRLYFAAENLRLAASGVEYTNGSRGTTRVSEKMGRQGGQPKVPYDRSDRRAGCDAGRSHAIGLDNAGCVGRNPSGNRHHRKHDRQQLDPTFPNGRVGDPKDCGCDKRGRLCKEGAGRRRARCSDASCNSGLANADGFGTQFVARNDGEAPGISERQRTKLGSAVSERGCKAGWTASPDLGRQDADWLFCRDEKWRPVAPGTFPLVDAYPGRVGELRAYGNALDLGQATAFVRAYMERGLADLSAHPAANLFDWGAMT